MRELGGGAQVGEGGGAERSRPPIRSENGGLGGREAAPRGRDRPSIHPPVGGHTGSGAPHCPPFHPGWLIRKRKRRGQAVAPLSQASWTGPPWLEKRRGGGAAAHSPAAEKEEGERGWRKSRCLTVRPLGRPGRGISNGGGDDVGRGELAPPSGKEGCVRHKHAAGGGRSHNTQNTRSQTARDVEGKCVQK